VKKTDFHPPLPVTMGFVDPKAALKSRKEETIARARAARQTRQAHHEEQASAALLLAHNAAATPIQRLARRWLRMVRSRGSLRTAWSIPSHPTAGQQLALCDSLSRFFDPSLDGERIASLCHIVAEGLAGADGRSSVCSVALDRHRARRWAISLQRLHICCARLLEELSRAGRGGSTTSTAAVPVCSGRAMGSAMGSASAGSAGISSRAQYTAIFRLLTSFGAPHSWHLCKELSSQGDAGR